MHQGLTSSGFLLRDGTGQVLEKKFGTGRVPGSRQDLSGNCKLVAKRHVYLHKSKRYFISRTPKVQQLLNLQQNGMLGDWSKDFVEH